MEIPIDSVVCIMQSQPFLPDIMTNGVLPEAGRVSVLDGNILARPGIMGESFLPRLDGKPGPNMDGRASGLDGLSTRDMRSRASINTRDVRSRISIATRDVKSRASSRRQHSGYYRKGRVDLSSEFRELLTRRLDAGNMNQNQKAVGFKRKCLFYEQQDNLCCILLKLLDYNGSTIQTDEKQHHTPRMQAMMEDLPQPPSFTGIGGNLGQLFTVLRPTVPENIILWPRDMLCKKFYSSHNQRHAMPRSLDELEARDSTNALTKVVSLDETDGQKTEGTSSQETKNSANSRKAVTSASTHKSLETLNSINEQHLQPLLEELYKDKKFLDKLIKYSLYGSDERIFAEKGRNFLINRAEYWAKKGRLPNRPPATNLGLQIQRMRTLLAQ